MSDDFSARKDQKNQPAKRKRSKGIIIGLVSVVVVAMASVGLGAAAYIFHSASELERKTGRIENAFPDAATRPTALPDGPVNILLLGSDSRGGQDVAQPGERSDSIMLVHLDAARKNLYVMSILRDLWVPIPGSGKDKINSALATGGIPLTVQTVESLLGTHINHVVTIDFEGFRDLTDALGGVDVTIDKGFSADHLTFVPGVNHLDGEKALAFVRERHAFDDGEFTRVENQRIYISALIDKLLAENILFDPGKLSNLVGALSSHLAVDDSLNLATMVSLTASMREMRPANIHYFTMPTAGVGSAGNQSVMLLDEQALAEVKKAFAEDNLASVAKKPAITD